MADLHDLLAAEADRQTPPSAPPFDALVARARRRRVTRAGAAVVGVAAVVAAVLAVTGVFVEGDRADRVAIGPSPSYTPGGDALSHTGHWEYGGLSFGYPGGWQTISLGPGRADPGKRVLYLTNVPTKVGCLVSPGTCWNPQPVALGNGEVLAWWHPQGRATLADVDGTAVEVDGHAGKVHAAADGACGIAGADHGLTGYLDVGRAHTLGVLSACYRASDAGTARSLEDTLRAVVASVRFDPTTTDTASAGPVRACQVGDLRLTPGPEVSPATGQHPLAMVLTNITDSPCTMTGYPALALFGLDGKPLPFTYERSGDQMVTAATPRLVRLHAGGSAAILANKYRCDLGSKADAKTVAVTPPGTTGTLHMDLPDFVGISWCGPDDPGSIVHVSPVEPSLADATASIADNPAHH